MDLYVFLKRIPTFELIIKLFCFIAKYNVFESDIDSFAFFIVNFVVIIITRIIKVAMY